MIWTWKKKWEALKHYIEIRKVMVGTIDIRDLEITMKQLEHGLDMTPSKPWPIVVRKENEAACVGENATGITKEMVGK